MLLIIFATASAHMHMTSPEPRFDEAFQYDKPAPSSICNLVQYYAGSGQEVIPVFNQGVKAAGFKNIREYADACARATSKKICGNTIPSASVPFPTGNNVQIDIGADHIGPSEIWVDDRLVMYNSGIEGSSIIKTPRSTFVDFAKECPSGDCLVRFVMAALHLSPAEVFDNCVRVTGSPSDATAAYNSPQVEKVVVTSYSPKPTIEVIPSKPTVIVEATNPESEWSCNGKVLVRNVNGQTYTFECPKGTECQTVGLPYAMCNWSL